MINDKLNLSNILIRKPLTLCCSQVRVEVDLEKVQEAKKGSSARKKTSSTKDTTTRFKDIQNVITKASKLLYKFQVSRLMS